VITPARPSSAEPAMSSARAELRDEVFRSDQRLLDLCIALVQVPSENPPGDTRAIAARVRALLSPLGARVEIVAGEPSMPNVMAVTRGRRPGRRLVFNGHLDTFPAGDRAAWSVDPFAGIVRDGRLYGRGISDMKGGMAASLLAFELLHARREHWDGELVLALASDEETMGRWGTAYLLETVPEARGDAMICGDCGSPMIARFGEKGLLWLRVTAHGRAAHGAHVHLGDNAAEKLAEALRRLAQLRGVPVATPPAIEAAIQEAKSVSEPLSGAGESEVLRTVTVNVGTLSAGHKINLVPDRATAEVDVRVPVGLGTEACLAEVHRLVAPLTGVEVEVLRRFEPTATDPGHEIFRLLCDNAEAVMGKRPVLNMRVGASDARLYRAAGVPTAVYGPTPYSMGGPDEHVTLEDLSAIARVFALTAFDFLAPRRGD
jgi:acetylornithine deacetylase/succinyl-diaminopimelate desuccinylase-like protein